MPGSFRIGKIAGIEIHILLSIWLFFTSNNLDGIWLGFIGWFLLSAAQSANSQGPLVACEAKL